MHPAMTGPRKSAKTPPGRRIYAVGDIHGRADLLAAIMGRIRADGAHRRSAEQTIVFLGDYVDRGGASFNVVADLIAGAPEGFEAVYLKGNHEDFLLQFLDAPSILDQWVLNGGARTLESYGVDMSRRADSFGFSGDAAAVRRQFLDRLPDDHRRFFRRLQTRHEAGDYLFVHAGVRPGVPLAEQKESDLLWIRNDFLESDADFGKIVVHGHSIGTEPEIRPNRIGIDTGAYYTDRLTCLVLDGEERYFLHT